MYFKRLFQYRYLSCAFLLLLVFAIPVGAQGFEPDEAQQKMIDAYMAETRDRLELTDAQFAAVEDILLGSFTEREALKEKYGMNPLDPDFKRPKRSTAKSFRTDMEELTKETVKQLSNHLTDDQMAGWKALEQKRADLLRDQLRNK